MQQQQDTIPLTVLTIPQIEEDWDEFSGKYTESYSSSLQSIYITMLAMLEIEQSDSILEVAAGPGYLVPHLLQRKKEGAKVYLTDLATQFLAITKKRLELLSESQFKNIYNFDVKTLEPFQQPYTFEKYNTTLQQANSENLSDFQDNSIQTYISNLCLQITSDPQLMIKEAFRVLQKGGKVCMSVWGDKAQSTIFSVIGKILQENGYTPEKPRRNNFHLNSREDLIQRFEKEGFEQVLCWNQFVPSAIIKNSEQIDEYLLVPRMRRAFDIVPEDKRDSIIELVKQHYLKIIIDQKMASGLDALVIMAQKPSN